MPSLLPKSNAAGGLGVETPYDLEHMIRFRKSKITLVTFKDLFGTLRAAEMHHHVRITQQLFQQRKVILCPGPKQQIHHENSLALAARLPELNQIPFGILQGCNRHVAAIIGGILNELHAGPFQPLPICIQVIAFETYHVPRRIRVASVYLTVRAQPKRGAIGLILAENDKAW